MDYQDMLAMVGAGSAHPGGMATTHRWMESIDWRPSMRVLEVGCGTGRTLVELVRRHGCLVTGVDIRREMIRKARLRAKRMGCEGRFLVAPAERLPFEDGAFDLVLTESVNVFCHAPDALAEYHRVLVDGGQYLDVEMVLLQPVSEEWKRTVRKLYGVRQVPDMAGWKQMFRQAGFADVRVLFTCPVRPEDAVAVESSHPDPVDVSTPGAYRDPRVIRLLEANARWMEAHHRPLGYATFLCQKRQPVPSAPPDILDESRGR